jgi:hypothetical protein
MLAYSAQAKALAKQKDVSRSGSGALYAARCDAVNTIQARDARSSRAFVVDNYDVGY